MNFTTTENDNLRLLSNSQKYTVNAVIIHTSNTLTHEMAKAKICYYLKKNNRKFVCEATFENGSRADVFDITWGVAYELIVHETDLSIENKREKYPVPIYPIKARYILKTKYSDLDTYLN